MNILGRRDSKIIPMIVNIMAPSIDPSYIIMAMAGIDNIGLPPVINGYANSEPAVISNAIADSYTHLTLPTTPYV